MDTPGWDDALAEWRAAIGAAHVVTDAPVCNAAATATFATTARVLAILAPGNRAEVAACMRIAHARRIAIRPTSRGKNWGYGSRAPARDAVLLDLSRLDRIVDFDEKLAYVTVEPGVTFRQLATFLRDARARVFASVTGGPADGSVVANALERGDGSGPLGDRIEHVCGLEVVLPTGEVVATGFANTLTVAVAKHGVGPSIDGLFAQSDLGIVTRMTIWLAPYPVSFQQVTVIVDDTGAMPAVIDALRELRLAGVTPATTPLWNDLKALSLVERWSPGFDRAASRAKHGFGAWNGTIALHGASREHGVALREIVVEKLDRIARVTFRDGPDDPFDVSAGPALGVPHDLSLASVYWRKPGPIGVDPDADRCGFLWLGHAIPFIGSAARELVEIVEDAITAAGFEPAIALLGVTPRALSAVASIAYDRDVDGDDARARACHDSIFAALVGRGYPPFRLGVQSPKLRDPFIERLRTVIDPHGVLTR